MTVFIRLIPSALSHSERERPRKGEEYAFPSKGLV